VSERTLVLGAAVSGRAASRLARRLGHDVTVYDSDIGALAAIDGDIATVGGEWVPRLVEQHDLVVTSPGIPPTAPPLADAMASGVELVSEMEFGYRHLDSPCLAVTGTNGKTTVTAATTEMLVASGVDAVAAGNIGHALSDVAGESHEVVVVEASSFQLQFSSTFHPSGAAILNVAPDHLDWHGSFEAYAAAKRRIGEQQTSADIVVYDVDDPGARAAVAGLPARKVPVSGRSRPAGGNGPVRGRLAVGEMIVSLPGLDEAFTVDLTAAATLAAHIGAAAGGIDAVIDGFVPRAHRRMVVGVWDGVAWVNDSKATNPHAAMAAIRAFSSVVLIAGGRNKGLDLSPLPNAASVRVVVALGEASDELRAATPPASFHQSVSLEHAVAIADGIAQAGDTVLLAPGCASFDMFDDYKERGMVFADLVRARKKS